MIFTKRKITINGDKASMDKQIVLYRGDREVEVQFEIVYEVIKYRMSNTIEDTNASFGQLVIKNNSAENPIVTNISPTSEGVVIFKFTKEMIDEISELGEYSFQIRLFDSTQTSRITTPIIENGIIIKEPLSIFEGNSEEGTAEVGVAFTGAARVQQEEHLEPFDKAGNYNETTWATGDIITSGKLNKLEDGITGVNQKVASLSGGGNAPTIKQIEPQELDMPKVFFYGNALPTTKDNVNLTMDYVSNTTKFSSFVKLKCQGTSSMSYAKKNFTVTMFSDEARATKLKKDFKGWGAQSKFCLKANYVDTTHTRNLSGARIGYDIVKSRPDSTFKQQLLSAPRCGLVDGFPIKLYFNGEFYGIYTWNIPKDGWMFNMDKSNPNHIVLCAERNTDGNSSLINSCQFRKLWDGTDGGDWSYEFGTPSNTVKDSLNRCIGFVMNSTDQEFHDNISEYFDLYSLLDYYCFSYLTCHLDGLAKNMLMVTYDGVIWGASLYDMDSIYGVNWTGSGFVATNYQCPEQYQERFSRLWVRIEQCFATELYARYLELRQGALSLSNIVKHVEEIYDVIPDRVFADEKAKWTNLPQVNNNTMTRFRNYMRDRAVYVDAQMKEIGTKVPCTGIVLSADTLSFTTTDTQTLSVVVSPTNCTDTVTWSVSPTGVVSVNNGVVTPISNGSCTITATCGSYSDTCAVTVSGMSESGGDTNLLSNHSLTSNKYIDGNTGAEGNSGSVYACLDYIEIEPNTKYLMSTIASRSVVVSLVEYDKDKNYISRTIADGTLPQEFTTNSNAKYIRFHTTSISDISLLSLTVSGIEEQPGNEPITLTKTLTRGKGFNTNTGEIVTSTNPNYGVCEEYIPVIKGNTYTINGCGYWLTVVGYNSDKTFNKIISRGSSGITTYEFVNDCDYIRIGCDISSGETITITGVFSESGGGNTGDYTDISYIESTGTQYINTRIVPTTSTKIELVADMAPSKQYDHIFGSDNFMKVQWNDATCTVLNVSKKNGGNQVFGLTLGKHTYVMDMTDTANAITIDGTKYGTIIGNSESTTNSLLLLSGYGSNGNIETQFCGVGKIYSCKIYYEDTLVANMKPVLTNSGTYGLLDTVNNTFYGSEVGSFTGGGTPSGGDTDTTLLYSLPEKTVFNGTNTYIDTGVALLSTDQDFTIVLDVTAPQSQTNNQSTLFHCMHEEDPYPGLSFMTAPGANGFYIPKGSNASIIGQNPYLIPQNSRTKVVIIKEGTTLSAYNSNGASGSSTYTYSQVSENLLIGAYQTTSGAKGRYFSGTVYDFKIYNKVFTSQEKDAYLDMSNNIGRVFKIDSTCMDTASNALIDSVAGISATLTGNPTVSDNQIVFDTSDTFSFDISSLNLTSSNRTLRIKFTPTTLDTSLRNVIGVSSDNNWNNMTSTYITSEKLILQHGGGGFANSTVGNSVASYDGNRLSSAPVNNQEYELVISENINGNARWYIDGTLVQDGTITLFNPLYISNTEGNNRFIGSYSLIEVYNTYCNDYTEFTNMINNM